ncbi:TonB-dependent receptor plug domain-containing protein [Lacinutrix iliipiscaria]|uniref:TonB-dependent receptor plug domain-containing protein n=1 Tax=Lacinutrix iliipiscaria TaxID=1230532 RepID=A0ABW5WQ29_9FLAO
MNKKNVLGMLCILSTVFGFSQTEPNVIKPVSLEEVVITDSKFKIKRENAGKVITKITQKDLEKLQGKSIAEIISMTAGVEINGVKSNAGQNLSYNIRGGRNRQVLILIDGIPVTDPSQIANDYDLRLLNADQVESIEILKGASSTLYGSGAASAVINITLKKASKDKLAANFRSVLGTNMSSTDDNYAVEDFKNSVAVNGTLNKFIYLASFGNQFTDGLSAVANGTESDAFNAINGNLKLGYSFSDAFNMNVYGSFDTYKTDFDDGFSGTDADHVSISDQYRLGIAPEFKYKNGSITLNAAYNAIERDIQSSFPAQFNAKSYIADVFNRYNFKETLFTVIGVHAQQNEMESFAIPFGSSAFEQSINPEDATFTIIDPYVNVVYASDFGLSVNAGARLNNHSEYGSHVVYSANPSFKKEVGFGYVKGLASYSTAYITPSLYQLFEPTYGNDELQPEENTTIEFGAEIHFSNKATLSLVYFNRRETNFIDFVDLGSFTYQYKNVDESFTASGFEFVADYNVSEKLKFQANATYTNVEEDLNLRLPEFKINASIDYAISEASVVSLRYQFNDDRRDSVYNSTTFMNDDVTLESYNLFDFYVSHKIAKDKITLFANVTNILNEDYQELYGYSTRGRNVNIGFNIKL